jgi:formate hydrogenlyase subunit 6/NADH:ubiquinone oxidoreductase subunit I
MMSYISNVICRRPVIDPRKCTRCGQCVQACPVRPKAVDWHDGNRKHSPSYKYLRCIRCYCCQEICPEGAISVKRSMLAL